MAMPGASRCVTAISPGACFGWSGNRINVHLSSQWGPRQALLARPQRCSAQHPTGVGATMAGFSAKGSGTRQRCVEDLAISAQDESIVL